MARKPIAQVGQYVVLEDALEDGEDPVEVLQVGRVGDHVPFLKVDPRRNPKAYAYRVKPKRGKAYWVAEYELGYVVTYTPSTMTVKRHAELAGELGGYEMLRDYLETLPRNGKGAYMRAELAKLVEQCALWLEGNSEETYQAAREIESILR